ncbi:arginase family protein [Agromyces atrinae]|uniref:Arginase family enzyme n=1 Tax=Agromyces atrinae TaxID=592376 RepID=A0A4Q2M397_9MICO|nr:arginase family protein [Agromyces atrinae]NYD68282.1 arginase family enzyme [Agromyces atrinae]RXZ85657.1 formimidoylglutamase [Agromyces atrinae]
MTTLSQDPLWPRAGDWPDTARSGHAALALLGVPAFRTSLSPTRADETPAAVREALRRYSPALIDPIAEIGESIIDLGDIRDPDGEEGEARTRAAVNEALQSATALLALGGDNSVTVATALGAWGDDLSTAGLITLDAHYDLRDGISNGSPVRRLIEAGLDPTRIVQIGIADFANSAAYARRAAVLGITVIHRDELHDRRPAEVMADALAIAGAAGGPIHLDVDVDVCDRSIAPACPASVPGGIAAWELRAFVRAAARDPRVRSADIVEIDATTDAADGRTVRLAALTVLEFAAGLALRDDA